MHQGCAQKGYKQGTKDYQTCLALAQNNPSSYGIIDGNTATMMLIPLAVGAATISDERAS